MLKNNWLIALMILFVAPAAAQSLKSDKSDTLMVEASCGQCQFGLPGKGCDLAVRINDKVYFVKGTSIDKHGDAHAKNGFCNAIRRARVVGRPSNKKFVASYFELTD